MHGEKNREVGGGLVDAHSAYRVDEDVVPAGLDAAVTVQHGEQQREPLRIETHRQTFRHAALHRVDERLDLDEQRPRALEGRDDRGSGDALAVLRQEQRRRIGHAAKPALGHREHAELVRCAEAVLDCTDQAKARVRIALEVEDGVDDVLEHARARDRALLRHVADEETTM